MLKHAFKEWAVICKALAEGRQAIVLRKGGIAEESGEFQIQHDRFWLFPTYVHQQQNGIQAEAKYLLERAVADKPAEGVLRLSHFAQIDGVYHIKDLLLARMLEHMHIWSNETVTKRFHYRYPGLFVLPVRVYRAAEVHELPVRPEYDGCRSWVELERGLSTDGATPVLSDDKMEDVHKSLDLLLNPTALA